MKPVQWIVIGVGLVFGSISTNQAAPAIPFQIDFTGSIVHGPFENQAVSGSCLIDFEGDAYKQRGTCNVSLGRTDSQGREPTGIQLVDHESIVEVIGNGRTLRITVGTTMYSPGARR